jgi:hypothetical protein
MKRFLLWSLVIIFLLVLLPQVLGAGVYLIGVMLFGWVGFLQRVIPEISISRSGIGMGIMCSALIIAGVHWLASWICEYNSASKGKVIRWKWSYSFSLYAGLWLLFLAAMGITGLVHQTVWLVKSKEPIMVARGGPWLEFNSATWHLLSFADDNDWNLAAARKSFFTDPSPNSFKNKLTGERAHVLFLPDAAGKLAAAILFPRDLKQQRQVGFALIERNGTNAIQRFPMEKLPEILARFETPGTTNH